MQKIIYACCESIVFLLIFLSFTQKYRNTRNTVLKSIVFIVSYTIFSIFIKKSVPITFNTIIIMTFVVLLASFLFEVKMLNSFIIMILGAVYIIIIESVVLIIFSLIYRVGMREVVQLPKIGAQIGYLIIFFEMFFLFVFYKKSGKNKMTKYFSSKNEDYVVTYSVLQIFMAALLVNSIQGNLQNDVKIGVYNILVYLIFIIFIILGYFDYNKKIKLYKLKANYESSKQYVENLEAIVDIIRKEKHDFSNTINVLNAMCALSQDSCNDKIKVYLDKVSENLRLSSKTYDTGNEYIDGLLSVKNNYAVESNIKLEVDIDISLSVADVSEIDFVSIVSNIIDNAIYELKKYNEINYKVISLYGYCEGDKYYLAISNNGPRIVAKDTLKIFQKGFSTKKSESDDHGYGLFIVKEIVSRNNGNIKVESNEEDTEFLFEFNIKKEFLGKNIDELMSAEYI
ncbi:sensor histidine kinase [Clostridium sp. DL1XJH146]